MKNINPYDYYVIHAWMQMKNGLALKGLELQLYAIIYNYSKDGKNELIASTSYLAELLNATQPNITLAFKRLLAKDLIIKTKNEPGISCHYSVNKSMIKNYIQF